MPKARPRLTAAIAASVAALICLSACSSDSESEAKGSTDASSSAPSGASGAPTLADPKPKDTSAVEGIEVTQTKGKKAPKVSVDDAVSVSQTTRHILDEGTGKKLSDDAMAEVDLAMYSAKDGKAIKGTETYTTAPAYFNLASAQTLRGVAKVVQGQKVGTRGVAVLPPEDVFGKQGVPEYGINGKDDIIIVFDVRGQMPESAKGTKVPPKEGLPTVEWKKDAPAEFTVPKGEKAPKKLVEQKLIKGDGPTVKKDQTAYVSYSVATWRDGKVFDSSMKKDRGPFGFTVGQGGVIPGFDEAVEGAKVGDRLLLVIPPKDGYGKEGSPDGTVKGTDTLIYVVDVLAAP
ncbi:MAG: FKBP-type peptidyl-prolyl cis-trans isomerase [Janibacter sp.]